MKKILLALVLLLGTSSVVRTEAQNVSVNINIGSQPSWGPIGYDYVEFYYIPEMNVYYNVPMSSFYYYDRGGWISSRYLPYRYSNYDLYGMYKVVINDRYPWRYNTSHIRDYRRYRNYHNQPVIYRSNDRRYANRNTRNEWYDRNNRSNGRNTDQRYQDRKYTSGRPESGNRSGTQSGSDKSSSRRDATSGRGSDRVNSNPTQGRRPAATSGRETSVSGGRVTNTTTRESVGTRPDSGNTRRSDSSSSGRSSSGRDSGTTRSSRR